MGKQWKQCLTLFWGGSKITEDANCSHEIKWCLLLGRKAISNLDSTLKSRDYFVNKRLSCQDYGFASSHVWMWELDYKENWTWKYWYFWTVVLEKTLESPLNCKEIQPSILKEITPGCSLEDWCWSWNSNTLATWWAEMTHLKRPWSWERLKAGGEGDDGGWDGWIASPTQWTWVWVNSGSWWWTGRPGMLQFKGSQSVGHDWVTEPNWTKYCWRTSSERLHHQLTQMLDQMIGG